MNDLCYEHSQDGVLLNSFGCVFVQKEVRCSSKIEIKVGLQYTKEKFHICYERDYEIMSFLIVYRINVKKALHSRP